MLPRRTYRWFRRYTLNPPVGWIDLGELRNTRPISHVFGLDRGLPVDRYYIEQFIGQYSADIFGKVLEIGTDDFTRRFGKERVEKSDILHVSPDYGRATIVADLRHAPHIPDDQFDCIICTQTLQFIYEVEPAIDTLHRILIPGGVLLATFPGISQLSRYDMDNWGEYWRFTSLSASRLFGKRFGDEQVGISIYGNVLAATAFLHGLAAEELQKEELDVFDADYEVLIGVRAVKEGSPS